MLGRTCRLVPSPQAKQHSAARRHIFSGVFATFIRRRRSSVTQESIRYYEAYRAEQAVSARALVYTSHHARVYKYNTRVINSTMMLALHRLPCLSSSLLLSLSFSFSVPCNHSYYLVLCLYFAIGCGDDIVRSLSLSLSLRLPSCKQALYSYNQCVSHTASSSKYSRLQ